MSSADDLGPLPQARVTSRGTFASLQQRQILEAAFAKCPRPSALQKAELAAQTGLDTAWITSWYKRRNNPKPRKSHRQRASSSSTPVLSTSASLPGFSCTGHGPIQGPLASGIRLLGTAIPPALDLSLANVAAFCPPLIDLEDLPTPSLTSTGFSATPSPFPLSPLDVDASGAIHISTQAPDTPFTVPHWTDVSIRRPLLTPCSVSGPAIDPVLLDPVLRDEPILPLAWIPSSEPLLKLPTLASVLDTNDKSCTTTTYSSISREASSSGLNPAGPSSPALSFGAYFLQMVDLPVPNVRKCTELSLPRSRLPMPISQKMKLRDVEALLKKAWVDYAQEKEIQKSQIPPDTAEQGP
ncbi:hypothetical protein K488DRAFT_81988 [Vararia minispora EC-137]|uniref:Uncharacterized protein n=1 Tax=Vararia minispora EC-137 TaxID=1314806 RepID=A0ACB8QZ49_9AGAM|nr:hypothetical protein K488DRAFT_81988 [Vararia minispora EC-137]